VTREFGAGTVAYRMSSKMIGAFKRIAAEKAEGADLN
jgi:hypothetical protein